MLVHDNKMANELFKTNIHACFILLVSVCGVFYSESCFPYQQVIYLRQKLAKQAESSGLGRIVSQPQSDLYIMFLLCEMFQHKFGCFIQNHPFHRRQVLCWRYVRQNRQVCSVEAGGGLSVSQPQSERRQPTKSQNMSFRHFYIVPSLSVEG